MVSMAANSVWTMPEVCIFANMSCELEMAWPLHSQALAFLHDHVVAGGCIAPGAVFFEMAALAGRPLYEDGLQNDHKTLAATSCTIPAPLLLLEPEAGASPVVTCDVDAHARYRSSFCATSSLNFAVFLRDLQCKGSMAGTQLILCVCLAAGQFGWRQRAESRTAPARHRWSRT